MSNLYTRIVKIILVSYLFINAFIWGLSPTLIDHYLSEFLTNKDLVLSEKSTIRYNPFISQIHITDLSIDVAKSQPNKGEVISIPSATLEFSLFKLFAKKAVIEKFDIDGLQADVGLALIHLNSLPPELIAEIPEREELRVQAQDEEAQGEGQPSYADDKSDENWLTSLTFEMTSFNINYSKVLFDLAGKQQSVELNQLMISNVLVSQKHQSGAIKIDLLFNKALFELDASLKLNKGVGALQYVLNLQKLNLSKLASVILAPLNSQYQNIDGLLSVKIEQDIAFNKADISSQIQDVDLILTGLSLNEQDTNTQVLKLSHKKSNQQGIKEKAQKNQTPNMSFNIDRFAIKDAVVDISLPHSLMTLINQEQQQTINITDDLILRSNLNVDQSGLIVSINHNSVINVNSGGILNKISTELVNISNLSIPDIDFLLENSQGFLQANLIELDDITLFDIQNTETPNPSHKSVNNKSLNELPLLNIAKLSFTDIQASNNGLKIGNIDIAKINGAVNKLQNGKIAQLESILSASASKKAQTKGVENAEVINKTKSKNGITPVEKTAEINQVNTEMTNSNTTNSNTTDSETKPTETKPTEPFKLYIGKVSLQNRLSFAISDSSVTPSYKNTIYINSLSIEPIDNSMPRVNSKVLIEGSLDQYSRFNIDADIKPFNQEKYIKADVTVTEFDLSTITTYLKDIMAIESGHLNSVTNFIIDGDVINGNAKLNLLRVELAESVDYDEDNSIDTFIPVNVALSMLKDGQGNIELDVPVEGSLDSPDFRLSGFMALLVQRATMSATKKYLINAFVPYANIVQIGIQAGDYILKVRFQDLILTTGEDDLPKSANIFLEQFASLMTDKKSTQITVCAMSTKADIGVEHSAKLTNNQLDKLNQLSLNRMKNFKNYMVDTHKIESARLLLCLPKIGIAKDAKPKLTFTS